MNSNRKAAIIVGILFIIATVAPIISAVPLSVVPLGFLGTEGDPDYLTAVSENESDCMHKIRVSGCSSIQRGGKTYSQEQ